MSLGAAAQILPYEPETHFLRPGMAAYDGDMTELADKDTQSNFNFRENIWDTLALKKSLVF